MSNDLLIDKRIIERNIKKGRLDAAEHRRMLEALPDLHGHVWHRQEVRAQQHQEVAAQPAPQAPASVAPPAPGPHSRTATARAGP